MSDTYLTRKTLLKRLKSKTDEMAWEEFVHFYKGFIFSIIVKMRVNQSDWDDLSQKVMLKIWTSLPQFNHNQQKGHFRSWVNAITKNTVLSFITSNKRTDNREQIVQQDLEKQFDEPEIDKVIDEEWERHISGLAFASISKKVPEKAMDAFLAGLRDESVPDTAKRLEVCEDMVYTYKSRVKLKIVAEIKNLRDMLE